MTKAAGFLHNQTALVTGGARRLGRAIALSLAAQGADIVLHYHASTREAEAVAADIEAMGRRVSLIQADLADPDAAGKLPAQAQAAAAGPITILVNNASIFPRHSFDDVTSMDFMDNININALAPFCIARAFGRAGGAETVINMLDARITSYDRQYLAYHASKRLLFTLTRVLALALAPAVRVNGIAPGLILPPAGQDEAFLDKYGSRNPLQKQGTPEHVMDAILFLLASPFITGQVLFVDGGGHLQHHVYHE